MPENLTPEEYAKKAIEMLEKAGRFDEEENNPTKAIDYYRKAAEYLERSGYMAHRVNDIRARIQELSTIIEQNQVYTELEDQAQVDQLQLDAFNLLEKAKDLVNTTQIDSAINLYDQAILKLTKSGWAENQLISLIENRNEIAEKANMKKIDLKELGIDITQQEHGGKVQQAKSVDSQEEIKRKKIESFKTKKQKEQETQNEAFRLIDEAKDYEKEKKYEDAIMNLEKSVKLLNSIGWSQQTKNIQKEINRLKGEEEKYQRLQSQKQQSENYLHDVLMKKLASEESEITKSTDLMDFEETKKKEERAQKEAFKLIDIGKELEREKKYEEAIQNFEEAIKILHDINWDSYVQPIEDFISQIRIKQQREERLKSLREKREKEVSKVQESFKKKQKESFVKAAQQLEKNRIEFEKNRLKQIQKEQNFFNILNEADEDLKKGNHESALEKYKRSLEIIKTLGSGWESYIPKIEETIEKVKDRQDQILEEELEAQRKKEKRIEDEMEFQSTILQKLEEERQKLKEKELELKEREEDKKKRNELKNKAFKFIETAQEYTNQGNYERAIYAYRQASNLFAQIQWAEEIPIIEEAIESLERRKQKEKEEKEKELQEKIKKHKEEKEFQELISKSLKEEREKLRKKEIALKQKEQEYANRQKKRDKAFNILSDAKNKLEEGNFDTAIDLYHEVANIFAAIGWKDEVETIQKAIYEIEEQKKQADLEKEKQFEKALKEEKEEHQFQQKIANEMRARRKELERKSVVLREKEKEIQQREIKREKAFRLLDKAQSFLENNNLDQALELYYEVSNIFAQIQWTDELPLIENAIQEIKKKKKQKEEWQKIQKQKEIKAETENLALLQKIKRLKEKERTQKLKQKELEEKVKELSAQKLENQKQAFDLIEQADDHLANDNYDTAIQNYKKAIETLREIGWSEGYLRILLENLNSIKSKKQEKEKESKKDAELDKDRREERQVFQRSISETIDKQKERLKRKEIQIQKKEEAIEGKKEEAFRIMDTAEKFLNEGKFDEAIEKYRKAELILNEIQYPTVIIKEMIEKIKLKKKERERKKEKENEQNIKKKYEEQLFRQRMQEQMEFEKEQLKQKELKIKEQENYQQYIEKRKNHAFDLLEDAEIYLKQGQYNKALNFYRKAELVLSEIQYPTTSIKQMIKKVKNKIDKEKRKKQIQFKKKIQEQREEKSFQQKMSTRIQAEQFRLKQKQTKIQETQRKKQILEEKKQKAFFFLDKADNYLKELKYNQALIHYRKAQLILTEINFPTKSIEDTINRVQKLKDEKEKEKEEQYKRQLQKLEEEKEFELLIEQRKQYEKEKKKAHQVVLKQRERMIQEQQNYREAAYNLLEEATQYLKREEPEYEKAISLYSEARDILAEKVGWEPEIRNLNDLIANLQEERNKLLEKKRAEREEELNRIRERERFERELEQKRKEELKKEREKVLELEEFKKRQEVLKEAKNNSLRLIDKAQKLAEVNEFSKAYEAFDQAIENFKELGWHNQIPYIEKEVERVKQLEAKIEQEKLESQKLKEELQRKRELEKVKSELREKKKKKAVTEVGNFTHEISDMIEKKKYELQQRKKLEQDEIKKEAKSFRKDMGHLIKLKEELRSELEREKEEKRKEAEELQKAKERQELDDIQKMIKEAKKKKKK